ncbi:MAG: hypothetical protein EB127_00165 [Alphaproteobacteria bacterium]|nr:hypothetical protein [Alphaproteobacteria bacterium]
MRVAKTNTGVDFFKGIEHRNQGSPDLRTKKTVLGTIRDIRFPDTETGRNGLQVIITFDDTKMGTPPFWFSLAEDAGMILSSVGNRDAVVAAPPRVSYTYHATSFYQGIAKIVCDNSYGTYSKYQNNQSNNVVGPVSNLGNGGSPPGADISPVKYNALTEPESIAKAKQLPEKLTPEQWQEYQIKAIQAAEAAGQLPGEQAGSMIGRGNINQLKDYSVYEQIYKNQLRSGMYDEALKAAALEAAIANPVAGGFEESTVDETQSIPLDQEEYIRNLKGL